MAFIISEINQFIQNNSRKVAFFGEGLKAWVQKFIILLTGLEATGGNFYLKFKISHSFDERQGFGKLLLSDREV